MTSSSKMASPVKCERLARKIDAWVLGILAQGGGDEQLIEEIYDYIPPFKTILRNVSHREMDALAIKYIGFYRFAKLLERLAEAIADERVDPNEFELKSKRKKPRKGFG